MIQGFLRNVQVMDDDKFRVILDRLGLSWRGYVKVRKGVKRRIVHHMQELGCRTVEDYIGVFGEPRILREVECLMTVSISHFFRDYSLWRVLCEEILPDIVYRCREVVHVWSAGCALGQEVYSFAMLWDRLRGKIGVLPERQILATDVHPEYLDKAMKGIYGKSGMKGITEEMKATYFILSENLSHYRVADFLKANIEWQIHDLVKQSPPARVFQVVFLRNNLLTYYRKEIQEAVCLQIMNCLERGGFLIIGSHEKLPVQTHTLLPFKKSSYIFQKI
ncbi:MAG: hypothetical protein FJ139_05490 [Deltaproteobacteria bacterium]|nr:hypothetical protein [Deltaproteobacteria bacterium]